MPRVFDSVFSRSDRSCCIRNCNRSCSYSRNSTGSRKHSPNYRSNRKRYPLHTGSCRKRCWFQPHRSKTRLRCYRSQKGRSDNRKDDTYKSHHPKISARRLVLACFILCRVIFMCAKNTIPGVRRTNSKDPGNCAVIKSIQTPIA